MPTIAQGPTPLPSLNPYAASNPDYMTRQYQLQRNQQLAQALTQQGMSPIDYDPRGRISWTQGAAKLASALVGGYMGNSNAVEQGKLTATGNALLQRDGFNIGGGDGPSGITNSASRSTGWAAGSNPLPNGSDQPAPSQPSASPQDLARALAQANQSSDPLAALNSSQGWTGPNSSSNPPAQPPQPSMQSPQSSVQPPTGPLVMPGMSPQQSYMAYQMDPQGYMQALIGRSDNRTDMTKSLVSMGIDPASQLGRQVMAGWVAKQNYIAPVEMRPGGGLMDPRTGAVTTMPAAAPGGFQNVQLADGSWGTIPVRGGTDAITQSTGAGEAGKAPYQLVDTFNNGVPGKNFAGNTLPIPQIPSAQAAGSNVQPLATFDLRGTPQQQAAILTDIARNAPDQPTRNAALARLQQIQGGSPPQSSTGGGANGVQSGPAVGQVQGATNAQDELSKTWAAQQQSHAQAQTNIYTLQSLKALTDRAITGGGGKLDQRAMVAKLGAYLGIPGAGDAAVSSDLMDKYSAQLVAGLSARGMSTDAARDLVMAGTPNSKMQPAAIKEAVDGLIAREQMTQARTGALQPYAINRDPAGFQSASSRFDTIADPRLWQMRNMTPQQLQAFTARMPAADAQQLMQKYQAASQMGVFQ